MANTIPPISAEDARELLRASGGLPPELLRRANELIMLHIQPLSKDDAEAQDFSHFSSFNYREFLAANNQASMLWNQVQWDDEAKLLLRRLATVYKRAGWEVKPKQGHLEFYLPREVTSAKG